jgi:hypothetical protein
MKTFNLHYVLAGTKRARNLYYQDMADILLELYNSEDLNASACY